MARKTTPHSFPELVKAARSAIPGVAITTDVMVGFPGETEEEFAESLSFVEAMQFAGGHVFVYSARPGTAAARMPGQVPHNQRKARSSKMRECSRYICCCLSSGFFGSNCQCLMGKYQRSKSAGLVRLGPDR